MILERKVTDEKEENGLKITEFLSLNERELFYKLQYKNFSVEKRFPNTVVGREGLDTFKKEINTLDKFIQYLKSPNSFNL